MDRPSQNRLTSWRLGLVGLVLTATLAAAQTPPPSPQTPKPPPSPEFKDLDAMLAALPAATSPVLDAPRAHYLIAAPLGCLDQLQPRPTPRPYFWEATFKPVDGYDKTRAFYGCADWHSAVNATWTMIRVLKQFPDLSEGQLIREKLNDHLGKSNFEGELAFFKEAPTFERPYGQAWLLKLHAELVTWDDPQAGQWAASVAPFARGLSEALVDYLKNLDQVSRTGAQTNTAWSLGLMLDALDVVRDYPLRTSIAETARKFYSKDVDCKTESEPATGDLVSPCLSEAALMSRVLDQAAFVGWLDTFVPAANSARFKPLTTMTIDLSAGARDGQPARGGTEPPPAGAAQAPARGATEAPAGGRGAGRGGPAGAGAARVAPIGLAFTRAEAFRRLADALPAADKRAAVFRRLSTIHADKAAVALKDPIALEAPWLGAFALSSLQRQR